MKRPRYKVATCYGYPIGPSGRSGTSTFGVTASVLDTATAHREVARFRSSDRYQGGGRVPRGIAATLVVAEEYAAALNAGCEPT